MPRKPKEQRTEDGRVIQFTTIKARLYPNGAQAELFEKTFGCCRYIWNRMLADQQRFYLETGAHFIPTPAKYKKEAPFLREVENQALIPTSCLRRFGCSSGTQSALAIQTSSGKRMIGIPSPPATTNLNPGQPSISPKTACA